MASVKEREARVGVKGLGGLWGRGEGVAVEEEEWGQR